MSDSSENINQLQLYEQSLSNIILQKQQFQSQLNELNSALKEIKKSTESYKIIGNIMVNVKKEDLTKDLDDKHSMVELRVKTLEKQETSIREKFEKLQGEVMKNLEEKND